MNAGFGFTWLHDFPEGPNGYPNTPNAPADYRYTMRSLKASGLYDGPWGIRVGPVLRHQSGSNFARTVSPTAPASCDCFFSAAYSTNNGLTSNVVFTEPYGARRRDNITLIDVRVEKTVSVGPQVKVRLFLDIFNVTNKYAAETITIATGPNFLRPAATLAPRTARVGFRFLW